MEIYRRCGRCNKRIPSGSRCDCLKIRHKEYDRFARDRESKKFYDSVAWKKVREYVLAGDGLDVFLYMTTGQVVAADMVHHIVPLRDNRDMGLSVSNLISLSSSTHGVVEQMYKEDKDGAIRMLTDMLRRYREKKW